MATPYNPYPPQQPNYQQPNMYAPQEPRRSAIPKVIGILMIIFGSLGLLFGLIGLVGSGGNDAMFRNVPELKTWNTIEMVINVIGLGISLLQLMAGLKCIGYKTNAPALAITYSLAAMVSRIVYAILVYAWAKPLMAKAFDGLGSREGAMAGDIFGIAIVVATLFGVAWPLIALILMSRPNAKAACVNP